MRFFNGVLDWLHSRHLLLAMVAITVVASYGLFGIPFFFLGQESLGVPFFITSWMPLFIAFAMMHVSASNRVSGSDIRKMLIGSGLSSETANSFDSGLKTSGGNGSSQSKVPRNTTDSIEMLFLNWYRTFNPGRRSPSINRLSFEAQRIQKRINVSLDKNITGKFSPPGIDHYFAVLFRIGLSDEIASIMRWQDILTHIDKGCSIADLNGMADSERIRREHDIDHDLFGSLHDGDATMKLRNLSVVS